MTHARIVLAAVCAFGLLWSSAAEEDEDVEPRSLVQPEPTIEVTCADFETPQSVYALYCRALKAGDLRAAMACLEDDANFIFERGARTGIDPEFDAALKAAAAAKPGKLLRTLTSPEGSRVILVHEEQGALLGVVCRKPLDLRHWIISSWQGDWENAPATDDWSTARSRCFTGPDIREQSGARTLGCAGAYCGAPGTTVRWYEERDFEDNETTVQLKQFVFEKAGPLVDEKTERLASRRPLVLREAGLVALLVRKMASEKPGALFIRTVNARDLSTVWEKPWPGEAPEELALEMGAAGLAESGGDLLAVPQEHKEAGTRRFDAKTGAPKELEPELKLGDDRAAPEKLGERPDNRQVWLSRAKDAEAKARALEDPEAIGQALDTRVHWGKPGDDEPQNLPLQNLKAKDDAGLVEALGLSSGGLLLCATLHKDRTVTLFARALGEDKNRWTRTSDAPLLHVQVLGERLLLQFGKVITTRQPVMASFAVSGGVEMASAADGKTLYKFESEPKNSEIPMGAVYVRSAGAVDLYRGEVGEDEARVWFGVDQKTGKKLWRSSEAFEDAIVDVDEKSGHVLAMGEFGRGLWFDPNTGRQAAIVKYDGLRQGEQLVRVGDGWLAGGAFLKQTEKTLTAEPAMVSRIVEPEEVKQARKNTPLHEAAAAGNLAEVQALLKAHPEWISTQDPAGMTPLFGAALNGRREVVGALLDAKADANATDIGRRTVLEAVAGQITRESTEMAKMLLDRKLKIDATGLGWILNEAIRSGRMETIKLLVARGASLNIEGEGETPALFWAVWCGRRDAVEFLLASKADPNVKTAEGDTPLKAARQLKKKEIEALLLKSGAKE